MLQSGTFQQHSKQSFCSSRSQGLGCSYGSPGGDSRDGHLQKSEPGPRKQEGKCFELEQDMTVSILGLSNPLLFCPPLLCSPRPHQFPELLSTLMFTEQKVGCSLRWRLHEKLLQRYSCLARLLPGELLHQTFSPRIFVILTTNVSADVGQLQ